MHTANSTLKPGEPSAEFLHGAAPGQYLRFALGQETYAVGIAVVREILEIARMTPLPLMPGFIKGVMNLRGAVVPVIDLRSRCGLHTAEVGKRSCIVVVEVRGLDDSEIDVLGMLIDAVHEVVEVHAQDIEPTPQLGTSIAPEFIAGMARVRSDIVAILNLNRVLERQEMSRLIADHKTND